MPGPALDSTSFSGQVVSPLSKPCAAFIDFESGPDDSPKMFYALRIERGSADGLGHWSGIVNFADAPAETLRACTSSEGVHFTAWQGKPLHSKRLWHAYFYLGYEVERSCDDKDFTE